MHGQHLLKSWSTNQTVVALSSGEAEYYSVAKAAGMGLGMKALCKDMGVEVQVQVFTDSSAARGIAMRRGLGRIRHMEVCYLWIQEKLAEGKLKLHKMSGTENPSDLLTKHLARDIMEKHMQKLGLQRKEGRSELAPELIA